MTPSIASTVNVSPYCSFTLARGVADESMTDSRRRKVERRLARSRRDLRRRSDEKTGWRAHRE